MTIISIRGKVGGRIISVMPGENEGDPFCSQDQNHPFAVLPGGGSRPPLWSQAAFPRSGSLCPGEGDSSVSSSLSCGPACAEGWEADVDSYSGEGCIIGLVLSHGLDIPRKHRRRMALGITSVTDSLASPSPFELRVERH